MNSLVVYSFLLAFSCTERLFSTILVFMWLMCVCYSPLFLCYSRMHASNLLKAVLKPQAPSSREKSPVTVSEVPCGKIPSKKSARKTMVSTSAPVKMTCLCAPTKHAGSFRCRLHRSQTQWGGRPMPSSPPKTEEVEAVLGVSPEPRTSSVPEMILKPVVSLPAPPPNSLTRSPPRGASRLNRMAIASQSEATDVLKPLTNE